MDMQLLQFTNRMKLSNCITDDIAICINDDMQIQSAYLCFNDYPIFNVLFIFVKTQIM